MSEKRNLPTIQELKNADLSVVSSKQNELNLLLNQNPDNKWVKIHPMAKGVKYMPIERIEWLLTSIFQCWKVEIKSTILIANSIVVSIRLHYQSVLDGSWNWQDGIGAMPLQTEKGASATDFSAVKNDAVMKAAPAAESYAVKDAAEKLGKIFGKDLNRADQIGYSEMRDRFQASIESIKYAECLIETSIYNDEEKHGLMQELCDITEAEIDRMIQSLKMNQKDRISSGEGYNQTDIKNKLKSEI